MFFCEGAPCPPPRAPPPSLRVAVRPRRAHDQPKCAALPWAYLGSMRNTRSAISSSAPAGAPRIQVAILQALWFIIRAGVPAGAVIRPFGRACVPETFTCGLMARRCSKLPPVRGGALRMRTMQCEFSVIARARQQLFSVFHCFVVCSFFLPLVL